MMAPPGLPPKEGNTDVESTSGEGSYSGTRNYQASLKGYLDNADVDSDAREAAPANADEARALEAAEQVGREGGATRKKTSDGS